jgi:hypothetical protein
MHKQVAAFIKRLQTVGIVTSVVIVTKATHVQP